MEKDLVLAIWNKVQGISDLDWSEIAEQFHLSMHPDTLRKAGVGIKMAADAGMLAVTNYRDQYVAKKQFFDQRREYNAVLAKEARAENLAEYLREAADHLNEIVPMLDDFVAINTNHGDNEAVLVLTDWHYGMLADNVWNKYNIDICRQRVELLREKVLERLLLNEVSVLHVLVLGDMANGAIHVTSRVAAEENVVDQLMQVSEMIAELINDLANAVKYTQVYCTYGNHMRTVQNKKDSIHVDNMERIIPWWLNERFKTRDDVVVCETGRDEMLRAVVCGNEVCGIHGDLDGGKDAALALSQMYERAYGRKMQYLFSGHLHSVLDTENYGITSIRAGGLCGTDEFAKNARLFSTPSQTLAIFGPGGLDALYHIRLGG